MSRYMLLVIRVSRSDAAFNLFSSCIRLAAQYQHLVLSSFSSSSSPVYKHKRPRRPRMVFRLALKASSSSVVVLFAVLVVVLLDV